MILSNDEKKDLTDAMNAAGAAFDKIEHGDTNLTTTEANTIAHARERMSHYMSKKDNAPAI